MAAQADLSNYAGIFGNNGISDTNEYYYDPNTHQYYLTINRYISYPKTDTHALGAYYLGQTGNLEVLVEGVYKLGTSKNTGLKGVDNGLHTIQYDDFDIQSYAFAADLNLELKDIFGWISLKPHIGFMYTSGDKDSTDDKLNGYNGVENVQQFSKIWGGKNTIIDGNFDYGSALYGYIPEFYGNGTPVFTGGLQNFAGIGNGRGDNPGITMLSVGLTIKSNVSFIYRTNVNMFSWNEDIYVSNMVEPITVEVLATGKKRSPTKVEAGYVGTEWDNEITLALSKQLFIKGMLSIFFPAKVIGDVKFASSSGTEKSRTETRLTAELIWSP